MKFSSDMSNYLLSYPINFCYDPGRHRQDIEVSLGGYFFRSPCRLWGATFLYGAGALEVGLVQKLVLLFSRSARVC